MRIREDFGDYFNDNEISFIVRGEGKYVSIDCNDIDNGTYININISHENVLKLIELLEKNK